LRTFPDPRIQEQQAINPDRLRRSPTSTVANPAGGVREEEGDGEGSGKATRNGRRGT